MATSKCISCNRRDIAFDCLYYCVICYYELLKKEQNEKTKTSRK